MILCLCLHLEGPEYGSMKTALKSCMESVDRLAECHVAVKDRLMSVVQARVKEWKNEHYKKSLIGGCREAKSFEDDFRKVCWHLFVDENLIVVPRLRCIQ